jgi:4-hydroxybenzoate polyprenyltransferase
MIINDMIDVSVDKINKPNKPLVNGSITRMEAFFYLVTLLSAAEGLSFHYNPYPLQRILHGVIWITLLYTPILKKIPLVKNATCAFLVSFSILFSGMASNPLFHRNVDLLKILFTTLFYGSLHNEILLDICDKEGDKQSGIYTLPVLFGTPFSVDFLLYWTHIVVLFNTFLLERQYSLWMALFYPLFFVYPYIHLLHIKYFDDSRPSLINIVKKTNRVLFGLLLYMCLLARR